jgi:quercetin dioxygenase-like cupin family protein
MVMKIKLLPIVLTIFLFGVAPVAWAVEPMGKIVSVDPETAEFATPAGLPDCTKMTALSGDPSKGPSVLLAKMSPGCTVPWHWHTASESLMIVSGSGGAEMKDSKPFQFQPGAYVSMPSHHVHQASCVTGCMMFISLDGAFDIHYVDNKGREIPTDKALKKAMPRASK